MLGVALATRRRLLLLDEPASGLSPTETLEFMESIKKINRELGITIVIIEHIMKVLIGLCNRLMIMENGLQIAIGPPQEVTKDPRVVEIYLGGSASAGSK
ncbi:Methionine import ATP-binding protein MetN [subsurface metagenome]